MLGLLGLLITVATAAAGLPRKQPAHPWAAEQPTAEAAVRRLHKMLPWDDEPMSEAEVAASFEAFLRARGGRLEPMWANHSRTERTSNLQRHHARRSERRRAQVMLGAPLFADATAQEKESGLVAVLDPAASSCNDPLATNTGQPPPCTYDCADLQQEYFPAPQSQTTRCFIFDPTTETWPEVGGQGDELLRLREQRFETHTYISREDGTNPPLSGLSFTMGEGRVCRNVTIKTMMSTKTHEEVVCLVDGEHEHNHTVTEEHSVEVVGYAESGVHDDAGGTTSFVIGECTDALIRVTTTSAGGASMTWSLDDGGHNGPWSFETSGEMGVEEHESCMFDNEFTLTRQGGGSGWEGSVEVAGFIHFRNTITIPNNENWIVQGIVDPVSGLPSSLDGRFKSGSAVDRSHANIVLRHLRISGQVAPLDVNPIGRSGWSAGQTAGFGGAFEYDGGSADPANLVKLVFVEVVFDHNAAACGAAVSIDGRAAMPSLDPATQIWESGIALTVSACTFFRNFASFMAGALFVNDAWPLVAIVDNSDFLHNDAVLWRHDYFWWGTHSGPTLRSGVASVRRMGNHYDGGFTSAGLFNYCCATGTFLDGTSPDEPDATWSASYEGCSTIDDASWWCSLAVLLQLWPALPDKLLRAEFSLVESSIADSVTVATGHVVDGAYMVAHLAQGSYLIERCRFERSGNFDQNAVGAAGIVVSPPPGGAIVPSWEFSSSEWIGNAGGMAPAILMEYGNFYARVLRCVFRENVAYQSGGAIMVLGPALSALLVEESVFDSNAVRKPSTAASSVDVTLRLNTGSFAVGASGGYSVPIWRIDDGPVHGIPYEQCQLASQFSQDAVSKGLPPSWPDLQCANVSYAGPDKTYSHVVSLMDGSHTLHTGLLMMTWLRQAQWGLAWIELVDTIGPLYPVVPDTRLEQFPGCVFNQCTEPDPLTNPGCSEFCPPGVATWSSYEFRVSSGKGGAIVASGPLAVAIRDSIFRTNEAPKGASLSVTAASSLRITNTTIDEPVDESNTAVHTVASIVALCAENPCEAGSRCTFADFSTFCEPCGDNEIGGDGVQCSACPSGTQPDKSHTQCVPCEPGQYSQVGMCTPCAAGKTNSDDFTVCAPCEPGTYRSAEESSCQHCPAGSQPNSGKTACESCTGSGKNAFSADGRECRDCPARKAPNDERTACFCQASTYGAEQLGLVTCRGTSFRSDGMAADECAVCPSCMDCTVVGTTILKSGWAFFGAGEAYQCPGADKFEACPPLVLDENTTMDSSTCAIGYEGPVCGNCEQEYNHLKVGNPCDPCDDGVINVPLVMGLFCCALAVGGAVISGALGVLQDFGVITDLRILVGFYQILGQASDVLDVVMPYPVPELVDFIKLLFLDVRKIVMLDCWNIGGFYGKIVTNIVAVPAFVVGVCMLIYVSQKRTLMAVIEAGAADTSGLEVLQVKLKQNLFLAIFLIYPTITTTLFRVPQCQYFGDAGFHEDDYTIDCGTTKFQATVAFAVLVIILIPIGVPAIFMMLMLRAKRSIGGVVNETALGGAKLVADDEDDEADTYGFLIKDYRPQYWYHEIVTYSRKLLLGGISVVMGRGTMAQTYFVISTEAFYLMHHMRTYPFVIYKHNVIEALGHCALMLLYAISLILRNEDEGTWDAEWFPKEGYGWFIVFIFAIVLPSPTVYFYRKDTDTRGQCDADSGDGFEENPLALEMDLSADKGNASSEDATEQQPARAKLAKMQREGKDARAQVQKLQAEVQQQKTEIQQQQTENRQLQEEIQQLEQAQEMDGDAVRKSEAALRKENAALKMQLAEAPQQPAATDLLALPDTAVAPEQAPEAKSQEAAMKKLAVDESLSEEARDSAKKALEALVSSQLLDIEQTAALKRLESEALFTDRQTRIEALAEAKKVEAEALAEVKKMEAEATAEVTKLETEAQSKRQKADATKLLRASGEAAEGLSEDMTAWLQRNRLQHCAADLARIAGATVLPSDLQYLTDEDVEEIGSVLTRVEKKRLHAAVKAQCEEGTE